MDKEKEDPEMGKESKKKCEGRDLEIIKDSSEKVRLDSYVNIDNDEVFEVNKEAQKDTSNKVEDTNIEEIAVNMKKDKTKSLSDLFPCGVCGDDLGKKYKGKSVLCTGCMHWCHFTKCSGLNSEKEYKKREFRCSTCVSHLLNSQKRDNDISSNQKENLEKNKKHTEIKKSGGRRVSFFDNSPIITGGREFPESKRKRKTREEETQETIDSSENVTDAEKSPIPKKTKIKETKKKDKNYTAKHQGDNDLCNPNQEDNQTLKNDNIFKVCIDCSQKYAAKYNNKDEVKCVVCDAGRHGCLDESNNKKDLGKTSKGLVWICGECMNDIKENTNQIEPCSKNISNMSKKSELKPAESNKLNKSSENVLEYQGSNITANDIKTLDNGEWVCDEIIALFLAFMKEDTTMNANKILLVNPSSTFLLKECEDRKVVHDAKLDLKINEMEWVFYPINNNKKTDSVGGTHWSLLLYCKKDNTFYHFDPIEDKNTDHAKKLVINTIDMNNFGRNGLPEYKDVACPQQVNTFDCGPYVMMCIQELTNNIISGKELFRFQFMKDDVTKLREQIQEIIQFRVSKICVS